MRRKIYNSGLERKRDQRIGAVLFPLVNIGVWVAYRLLSAWLPTAGFAGLSAGRLRLAVQLLPWAVNGALLAWAFILRPHIGVGYLTSFGATLMAGVMLGIIAVLSCVVSIPFWFIASPLGLLVFVGLALTGVIWFLRFAVESANDWWSSF